MERTPRIAQVAAALADTAERFASEFPGGAAVVERLVELGRGAVGDAALDALDQVMAAVVDAGPEVWARVAGEGRAVVDSLVGAAGADHPLARTIRALFDEAGRLAASTAAGDSVHVPDLDRLVVPLLDRLGAACVDAMLGGKR